MHLAGIRSKLWPVLVVGLIIVFFAPELFAGVPVSAQPDTVTFGVIAIPGSLTLSFTLTNTSSAPIQVDSLLMAGGNAADFRVIAPSASSFVLNPNKPIQVAIHFKPAGEGARNALLEVLTSVGEKDVTLSGVGLDTNAGIGVSASTINLGDVGVNEIRDTTLYFLALGPDSLLITNLTVAELSGTIDFTVRLSDPSQKLPIMIAKGDSLGVTVEFTAADPTGPRQCNVEALGDGNGKLACLVTANVAKPGMIVSPDSINFGNVYRGIVLDTTITIYSTQNVPLTITDLEIPAGNGCTLVNPPPIPFDISGHDSLKLHLRFNPPDTGSIVAALIILAGETFDARSFENVWIVAKVRDVPLSASDLSPIQYHCAVDTAAQERIVLFDTSSFPIVVTDVRASDTAIKFVTLPSFPLVLMPHSTDTITFAFERADDSSYATQINVMGGEVILRSDTLQLEGLTNSSRIYSSVVQQTTQGTAGETRKVIQVLSADDLTPYALTSLDFFVSSEDPDFETVDPTSFQLNAAAFPGATMSSLKLADGKTYDVTVAFGGRLDYHGQAPSSVWLLQYALNGYVSKSASNSILVSAVSPERSGCLDFLSDTLSSNASFECGDNELRTVLLNKPVFLSSSISPDPATSNEATVHLELSQAASASIDVVGADGTVRMNKSLSASGACALSLPLDIHGLTSGTYFIRISAQATSGALGSSTKKLVISR